MNEHMFDDAYVHIGGAKLYAVNHPRKLAETMLVQAAVWTEEGKYEEAESEDLKSCTRRILLRSLGLPMMQISVEISSA